MCLKSALGRKKTSHFLWGANCTSTSILFIAMWMFLLTAHLCADCAVKILSSCSQWTGSHIQGHYALGVGKIKHQIKADLGPFNRLSWTQGARSQLFFFSLLRWNRFLGPLLWCIIMSEFQLSSQPSLGRLPWQQSNPAQLNVCVWTDSVSVCVCVCTCVYLGKWGEACRGNLLISWPISIYMKTNYSSGWKKCLAPEQKKKQEMQRNVSLWKGWIERMSAEMQRTGSS